MYYVNKFHGKIIFAYSMVKQYEINSNLNHYLIYNIINLIIRFRFTMQRNNKKFKQDDRIFTLGILCKCTIENIKFKTKSTQTKLEERATTPSIYTFKAQYYRTQCNNDNRDSTILFKRWRQCYVGII